MKDKKAPEGEGVSAGQWRERRKPTWTRFPGPAGANVALRVAFARAAYGGVTAHAHASLEGEVCGVLVGRVCEDDEGQFVDVQHAVRGSGAREERGHVTFTQETWNGIHAVLEKEHPDLQIVGWYHTHPGFGVEFSEMDSFIQRHFFSAQTQVALVIDPLRGETALAMNEGASLRYLDRFWVDAREHRARVPTPAARAGDATGPASTDAVAALEARVSQLYGAVSDLRESLNRFLFLGGAFLAAAVAVVVSYSIYRTWVSSVKPPEQIGFVPVPVNIEGKPALIGVAVVKWSIPPELWAEPRQPPPLPDGPPSEPAPQAQPSPGVPDKPRGTERP